MLQWMMATSHSIRQPILNFCLPSHNWPCRVEVEETGCFYWELTSTNVLPGGSYYLGEPILMAARLMRLQARLPMASVSAQAVLTLARFILQCSKYGDQLFFMTSASSSQATYQLRKWAMAP